MGNFKKIIRFILLGILLYVIFIIVRLIFNTHYYGYHESKDLFRPKHLGVFNDTIVGQFRIESLYTNRYNDSIYLIGYKNDYKIILWRIEQYSHISFPGFSENKTDELQIEKNSDYLDINAIDNPLLEIKVKMTLPNEGKLTLFFNKNSLVKKYEQRTNYLYYYLKCQEIGFTSKQNYFDLIIDKGSNSDANFMVYSSKGTFYFILIYSLKNRDLEEDILYKMINFSDL